MEQRSNGIKSEQRSCITRHTACTTHLSLTGLQDTLDTTLCQADRQGCPKHHRIDDRGHKQPCHLHLREGG